MRRLAPAAAVVLLLSAAACRRSPGRAAGQRQQLIEGLVLSQSSRGKPAWTLKSRLAVLREDSSAAVLTDPVMEFYRGGSRPVSRVVAKSGRVDTGTHDVRLSTGVTLDSFDDKSRMTTDELLYSSARGRFETASAVEVRRPGGVLRGRGLEAKPDLSEIRIRDQRSEFEERPR